MSWLTSPTSPPHIMKELLPHLRAAALANGTPGMSCSKAAVVNLSSIGASMTATPESYSMFPEVAYRVSKVEAAD